LNASYISLAEIHRLNGNNEEALKYALKALRTAESKRVSRHIAHIHWILSQIYYDSDQYDKSIEECNLQLITHAGGKDNIKSRIWSQIGHCYKEMKNWDKAILYFDSAINKKGSKHVQIFAYEGLGEVYYSIGDHKHKLDCFKKAEKLLKTIPEDASTRSYRKRMKELS